jgi:hypothetical protein
VIEEGRVYVHFGSYGTAALDTRTGKVLWERRDLPCNHWRGPGSSPILHRDLLIVHFDGFDVQYAVALDKRTGRTVWRAAFFESERAEAAEAAGGLLTVKRPGDQDPCGRLRAVLTIGRATGRRAPEERAWRTD